MTPIKAKSKGGLRVSDTPTWFWLFRRQQHCATWLIRLSKDTRASACVMKKFIATARKLKLPAGLGGAFLSAIRTAPFGKTGRQPRHHRRAGLTCPDHDAVDCLNHGMFLRSVPRLQLLVRNQQRAMITSGRRSWYSARRSEVSLRCACNGPIRSIPSVSALPVPTTPGSDR